MNPLRRLLDGTRWGRVFPPRPAIPPLAHDGRTAALDAFADYLAEIVFRHDEGAGKVVDYQVARERFLVEWPDSPAELLWPSVVFEPGPAEFLPIGLTPSADESSRDRYGAGTVLVRSHEYSERVTLAIWASTRSQRRMLLSGIEWAFSPVEEYAGVRLSLPGYYGERAHFEAVSGQNVDTEDSGRRRRRSEIVFEMRFNLVSLRRYSPITPQVVLGTYEAADPSYEAALEGFERSRRARES